ncbi:MAG TPA: PQQ-dependent sugar dehydrogenase [Acidimicrobiia bacterium]|nr:PQQ-dependent sugar dehydrogenase [Acidimicrobiia bacterium]
MLRATARRRLATGAVSAVAAVAISLAVAVSGSSRTAAAAASIPPLALQPVAALPALTALAARAGDSALYVTQQQGVVRAVRNGKALDPPVLDISDQVVAQGEQGLLGLVFSPDGTKLYVDYTGNDGDERIDEFTMNGTIADVGARRNVLTVEDPQPNHNGGQLAFGPDGYLYIGIGDGGAQNDEGPGHVRGGNGQSLGTLLGKILRIDPTPSAEAAYQVPPDNPFVATEGARPEIWAYGLRNPWRFSFDTRTGDLWIGDVGQDEIEEIDFAPTTNGRDAGKGDNFGWNRLEGNDPFRGDVPAEVVAPVATQTHEDGWLAVIGGYVYRGSKIKPLRGVYLYSDYYKGDILGLRKSSSGGFDPVDLGLHADELAAFGQANNGELYVLSQSGGLLRLTRAR